jgi:hypothetical protein
MLEGAGVGGGEVLFPGEVLARCARPKGLRVANGFIVEGFVLVEILEVGFGGVVGLVCGGDMEGVDGVSLLDLWMRASACQFVC